MRLEPILESLKRMGFSQEEAEKTLVELIIIQKGRIWEHAHLDDVYKVVHRVLDWQHNKSVTIKVSKESDDVYDGHLEIEVIDIQEGKQP
jgi:CRISPR/Cas system type I-B associated protein Csh2 (Cas7 group RAMP superfamily)